MSTTEKLNVVKMNDKESPFWGEDLGLPTSNSETPGTSIFEYQASTFGNARATADFFGIHFSRPNPKTTGYFIASSPDHQSRPPVWMESKDVAIDGSPLSVEEKGSNWFEHKYAKEFYVAEMLDIHRAHEDYYVKHDIPGVYRKFMQRFGFWEPSLTKEQIQERVEKKYEASGGKPLNDGMPIPSAEKKALDWNAFVGALEGDKPLILVAQQYRNVHDVYGLDEFLNYSASVLWISFKLGAFIGIMHGGARALRAMHADASYTQAAGLSALGFFNVTVGASFLKWGGNTTICAAGFLLGDRMTTSVKKLTLPEEDWGVRTPINYSVGMGFAFSTVGIMPWWLLNEARMGMRLAVTGMFVGSIVGYGVGRFLDLLVAANLSKVKYTPAEWRHYTALMKRERLTLDLILEKAKREADFEEA
jgi:hypothetical protein